MACGNLSAALSPSAESGMHHAETTTKAIEDAFKDLTTRDDIAVVMINQYVRTRPLSTLSNVGLD